MKTRLSSAGILLLMIIALFHPPAQSAERQVSFGSDFSRGGYTTTYTVTESTIFLKFTSVASEVNLLQIRSDRGVLAYSDTPKVGEVVKLDRGKYSVICWAGFGFSSGSAVMATASTTPVESTPKQAEVKDTSSEAPLRVSSSTNTYNFSYGYSWGYYPYYYYYYYRHHHPIPTPTSVYCPACHRFHAPAADVFTIHRTTVHDVRRPSVNDR